MPSLEELLEQKNLQGALGEVRVRITEEPDLPELRSLAFDLLMVGGEPEAALEQLDALARLEAVDKDLEDIFRGLVSACLQRQLFYQEGQGVPGSLAVPPEYGEVFATAVVAHAQKRPEVVAQCMQEADPPGISGRLLTIDDETFEFTDFEDLADLQAPFLSAIVPGAYLWLPWESVRKLEFEQNEERSLFETIFRPARLEFELSTSHTQEGRIWVPLVYDGGGPADWTTRMSGDVVLESQPEGYALAHGWRCFRVTVDDEDRLFAAQGLKSIEIDGRST
jgi:protein involved in temperature-dependent protein secretion